MIKTTTLQNQFQRYFNKKLLEHAVYTLQLADYGTKKPLPRNQGARYISFFRQQAANAANVVELAEGSPIQTLAGQDHTRIDFELKQLGQASRFSDILSATELIDNMKVKIEQFGEECALKMDELIQFALVNATTGLTSIYQGNTSFANLQADATAAANFDSDSLLNATTQLRLNLAPPKGGFYYGVLNPYSEWEVISDTDGWLLAHQYGNDYGDLKKGEIGTYNGVRVVRSTNVFTHGTTQGVLDPADDVYSTYVFGRDAYGISELSGQSPFSPKMEVVDRADSANPLNQFTTVGWKAFYAVGVLNPRFGVNIMHKSGFTGKAVVA
jgi:N4-gp56 family major capsid protein